MKTVSTARLFATWLACTAAAAGAAPAAKPDANAIADAVLGGAGLRVGLCEMPRVGDGRLAVALVRRGAGMVHGLAGDAASLAAAGAEARRAGMLGVRLMVEPGRADALPLADWLADLVVVADATDENLPALDPAEIARVLSPYRGTAVVGNPAGAREGLTADALRAWAAKLGGTVKVSADAAGLWAVVRMPAVEGMDEWTHFEHNGGNNPVSADTVFELPCEIQYVTPPFVSAGGSSRFAGGRMFEMQGQQHKHGPTVSVKGTIWCRNAYNGQVLWSMPLPAHVDAKHLTAVATDEAFYLPDDANCAVCVLDPETGRLRRTIPLGDDGEQVKWFAVDKGRLVALIGKLTPAFPEDLTYHGRESNRRSAAVRSGKMDHGLRVCAADVSGGRVLWNHAVAPDRIDPRAVAAWDGKVAFLVESAESGFPAERGKGGDSVETVRGLRIVCLDAASGSTVWVNRDKRLGRLERKYRFIFGREYYPGMIACGEGVRLRLTGIYDNDIFFLDASSGATRWVLVDDDKKRGDVPRSFAGFIRDGKYYQWGIFDAATGEQLKEHREIAWDGGCGVRTWAPAGIFGNGNRGSVGLSVKSDCHMGSFVAGGLLHVPRGWCHCNGVWRGTFAFCPRGDRAVHGALPAGERLEAGEVEPHPMQLTEADWPVYRHDNRRTAGSPVTVAAEAEVLWRHTPATPYEYVRRHDRYAMCRQDQPTEPVAAGGLVFLGGSDGKVFALDAATGQPAWTYRAAGRVYAPPTVAGGCVYVGAADGTVTCLDARTGGLVWRFRAAPHERRIFRAGHLVSRWPVLGGVLVHDGAAHFVAGLASIQGVHVYALDARTGEVRWHNGTAGEADGALMPAISPAGFLTVHGRTLYLKPRGGLEARFDLATGRRLPLPDYPRREGRMRWSALGNRGREIAVLGDGFILTGGRSFEHELNQREGDRGYPSFQLKRFDEDGRLLHRAKVRLAGESIVPPAWDAKGMAVVPGGFGRYTVNGKRVQSPRPRGTQGLLMIDTPAVLALAEQAVRKARDFGKDRASHYSPCMVVALNGQVGGRRGGVVNNYPEMYQGLDGFRWRFEEPWIQVNAVALAANAVVFTRGHQATDDRGRLTNAYDRWTVAAADRGTGKLLWEHPLPAEPALNALCLDRHGRAVVTCRDGSAVCVGGENVKSGRQQRPGSTAGDHMARPTR